MRKRLIIDCDPGLGVPGADVDDNLAVLLALTSPEVELLGVTVTFGNTPRDAGMTSLRATLAAAGLDVPIFAGATAPGQLKTATAASIFLGETLARHPGEVHLLMLGPQGNLAAALHAQPGLLDAAASVTLMAGAFRLPFFAQRGDPNIRWDLPAARCVLATPQPKTLISMDACLPALFTAQHLAQLAAIDTPLARHLVAGIQPWLFRHTRVPGLRGFFPWDAVALAWLLDAGLFAAVRETPLALRNRGWRKATLIRSTEAADILLPSRLDGTRFMALLMDRLLAQASAQGSEGPTASTPSTAAISRNP